MTDGETGRTPRGGMQAVDSVMPVAGMGVAVACGLTVRVALGAGCAVALGLAVGGVVAVGWAVGAWLAVRGAVPHPATVAIINSTTAMRNMAYPLARSRPAFQYIYGLPLYNNSRALGHIAGPSVFETLAVSYASFSPLDIALPSHVRVVALQNGHSTRRLDVESVLISSDLFFRSFGVDLFRMSYASHSETHVGLEMRLVSARLCLGCHKVMTAGVF